MFYSELGIFSETDLKKLSAKIIKNWNMQN